MKWVEQPDEPNGGCGIACLAMLLEIPYNRVRDLAPAFCEKCGVEEEWIDHVLAEHGYAMQRLHEFKDFDGSTRAPWPPRPWAEKHIALVMQTRRDRDAHHVCMDARGLVYDPADTAFTKARLSRYYRVLSVAAVVPVN